MKAILLAAGRGRRLEPLTRSTPKILAPLNGRTLLQHQLSYLAANGVSEVAINVHHHRDRVLRALEHTDAPLEIRLSIEPRLLGTAGALLPLREFITESVLVLYGDVVTDVSLADLFSAHQRLRGLATLGYYETSELAGKGLLRLAADGRITAFAEKPRTMAGPGRVNAGIYCIEPELLELVEGPCPDFGLDVWPRALSEARPLYGYEVRGYVRDIGTPEALAQARRDLAARVTA